VRVEGQVTRLRAIDDEHGLVETTLRIKNQDDRLVARLTTELVWR
jgi:acyl dehydratase